MFDTHTCLWTRPYHASQNVDPVTLTSESAFRCQKLGLGFQNVILAAIPVEGSLLYLALVIGKTFLAVGRCPLL